MTQDYDSVERDGILTVAEDAIREAIGAERIAIPDLGDIEASGLFVTVRVAGRLRGCIGFVELLPSFLETLREAARRSATADPRFPSLTADELDDLVIEVTLLGPLQHMEHEEDFEIGTHGLVIDCRGRRGLLLPQVPVEHGWDKRRFLSALAEKAYLPPEAIEDPSCRLSRFTGTVISGMRDQSR